MNTKRCDEFLDDRGTYNRLDKTAIGSDSAGSPKGKAYWDGKLGGGSVYEGLRKKKGNRSHLVLFGVLEELEDVVAGQNASLRLEM